MPKRALGKDDDAIVLQLPLFVGGGRKIALLNAHHGSCLRGLHLPFLTLLDSRERVYAQHAQGKGCLYGASTIFVETILDRESFERVCGRVSVSVSCVCVCANVKMSALFLFVEAP